MPFARGHVRLPNKNHVIEVKQSQQRMALMALDVLQPATEAKWDSRDKGWIPPIKNQAQCGSCWNFSGTGLCEIAFAVAGIYLADGSHSLSEQYTMSCGHNGGCNGDDNINVLDWAKKIGLPFARDYGPYVAQRGMCRYKPGMKLNHIDNWGFVSEMGIPPIQSIKNNIKAFGAVGCAVAAGPDWDHVRAGQIINGRSTNVNHDVIIIGWDDNKGVWIVRNSWGPQWADGGYAEVEYGADQIGTEAVWAVVKPLVSNVLDLFI
jgi:C1A family cysteine protease